MQANHYQMKALETENWDHGDNYVEDCIQCARLMQGLMGLSGESGEAMDILKKHLFQGHPLDREHLVLELGDVAWYLAISADALGYTLDDIFAENIEKLRRRYPNGFEANRSMYRQEGDDR